MSWALTQESDLASPAGVFLDVKGRREENIPFWIMRQYIHFQKIMSKDKKTGCFFRLPAWSGHFSFSDFSFSKRLHPNLPLHISDSRGPLIEVRKCGICQVNPLFSDCALWKGRWITLYFCHQCARVGWEEHWFIVFANFHGVFLTQLISSYQWFNWWAKFLKIEQLALRSWCKQH